jgi:cephalosporin-C deacetylase
LEDVVPHFDLPLEELRRYAPDLGEPDDLDAFWRDTLADARTHDLEPTFERVDNGLALIETFDVSFSGFGGDRIRGWLHRPLASDGPLPAVVEFLGYGGGRGLPHEKTIYAQAGFVHLVMDTRGQGSG